MMHILKFDDLFTLYGGRKGPKEIRSENCSGGSSSAWRVTSSKQLNECKTTIVE